MTVDLGSTFFFRDAGSNVAKKMSTTRLISHEMGHAVMGTMDAGSNNVILNADPIMREINQTERRSYTNFCLKKSRC